MKGACCLRLKHWNGLGLGPGRLHVIYIHDTPTHTNKTSPRAALPNAGPAPAPAAGSGLDPAGAGRHLWVLGLVQR